MRQAITFAIHRQDVDVVVNRAVGARVRHNADWLDQNPLTPSGVHFIRPAIIKLGGAGRSVVGRPRLTFNVCQTLSGGFFKILNRRGSSAKAD